MTNFNDIELRHIDQILIDECIGVQSGWIINPDDYTILELIDGLVPLYESELEAVEEFAADNNLIGSEMELSEVFDDQHKDFVREHCVMNNGSLDHVMINEEFNNWTDSLCKDGVIHMEQYNNYCYVGEWSDD